MLVGQQFGPFTIDKELGSGAMGTVYRGRYTKTGQVMAIKIMAPGVGATNAAAADRFEREITILKQLNHPNIVRFHGAGKQQGMRYFAMEYIEGESLDRVMNRRGRMTWEEVVELGKQLCAALQHAHEKGIIHRDLKPSNIMVLPDGTLKLTDFGIAKGAELEGLTATNCTVGTASYMSPEQCKGERNLTHKSDLYSLGVLFYELLTGKKPFQAEAAMEMFLLHVQGKFERPSRLVLDIPVWLDTLVCQLMEKKPEQRPLDAAMVARTLEGIQEKVEAQQSAGVEAVRRRMGDRTAVQKRPDEEDKEAARLLLTGKGKPKRKPTRKPLYQQVWLHALGLSVLLAGAGVVLFLTFFRAPPEDRLYQQARKAWESGNFEEQEKSIERDGAVGKYLHYYGKRDDEHSREVRGWQEQIKEKQSEQLLVKYVQRMVRGRSALKMEAQDQTEEDAFAAAKNEEENRVALAAEKWQKVAQEGGAGWKRLAAKRLQELQAVNEIDAVCQGLYEQVLKAGEEPAVADPPMKLAFRAWRAKISDVGDAGLAKSLFDKLKQQAGQGEGLRDRWYIWAALNSKKLGEAKADAKAIKEKVGGKLDEVAEKLHHKPPLIPQRDALPVCLDVLALYGEDEEMKPLTQKAETLRKEIAESSRR